MIFGLGDAHGPVSGGYSVSVFGANFGTTDTGVVIKTAYTFLKHL